MREDGQRSATILLSSLNDILDLAKMSRQMVIEFVRFDLRVVARSSRCCRLTRQKGLAVALGYAPGTPLG